MSVREIKTVRVGDKVIVTNGVDPLAYVDLTKVNKGSKRKAIVRFKAKFKTGLFTFGLKGVRGE